MLCVVPPLGLAGTLMFRKLSSLATLTQKNTAGAGGVAEVGGVDLRVCEFRFGFLVLRFGILEFLDYGLDYGLGVGVGCMICLCVVLQNDTFFVFLCFLLNRLIG